ncbi:uncharacterized protein M6B38_334170 [Iris pallida]|uniref:Uncharacterized protein n=1 Tax=Iris pallida TaxID=29817 RepID=A0AAX6H0S3_IRIPA|nr:uncharacterized protein M6B38_334170 [Iris pallida]
MNSYNFVILTLSGAMETPLSSSKERQPNPNPSSPCPSPNPSPSRLWRPAAQRNLRNQWSKLLSSKNRWLSAASQGRSHATSLVNAHLSRRYMPDMDLGALRDMPGIRQKASEKLSQKQEVCRRGLLSSYEDMVSSVSHMVKASNLMRCFLKDSAVSHLVQFCDHPEDINDPGDGGGFPVFSFLSVPNFEKLAQELVEMFMLELNLKRLLVVELLSITCKESGGRSNSSSWSYEVYPGEFDDLRTNSMLSEESCKPHPPRIKDWPSGDPVTWQANQLPSREVLQVYLTTWLADVNIDINRIDDIFGMVEEEMQVKL